MAEIPWALIDREPGSVAVGTLFVHGDESGRGLGRSAILDVFEQTFAVFELEVIDYRHVPIHPQVLGELARATMPEIVQAIIARPRHCRTEASFEARLYHAKQTTRTRLSELGGRNKLFFTSLSCRTIVYKALTRAQDLPAFYPDLIHPRFHTRFALFHRRFSTNTRSTWDKAQPFRCIAHNGEINTIEGNRSWSYAREQALGLAPDELLTHRDVSDSGNLNEQVEALRVRSSIPQVEDILAITIPVAGVRNPYYSFWGRAMEPWDGPALIAWSDGRAVGARLDRNGFRPARWARTADSFVLASEAGIFDLPASAIVEQGMLAAGSGVKVDLGVPPLTLARVAWPKPAGGEVHFRDPSRSRENEGAGFDARLVDLPRELPQPGPPRSLDRQGLFGLSEEELDRVLVPMIASGKEPIGSMGDTARLAIFSDEVRSFYDYFFQTFAQVTNPPLDYLREKLVTDLSTFLGKRPNILAAKELLPQTPGLRLQGPVLSLSAMAYVRRLLDDAARPRHADLPRLRGRAIDIGLAPSWTADPAAALDQALERIAAQTLMAAAEGRSIVVLSDRECTLDRPPVPSLLALRAAVVALNREGLRLETSIVLESGELRSTHAIACAVGFGATALCPYLALELARWSDAEQLAGIDPDTREQNLVHALHMGLLKIMSKMGISVLRSYSSAKLFTALGVGASVIERFFPTLSSPIGGVGLPEIADSIVRRCAAARQSGAGPLPSPWLFKEHPRGREGELHSLTAARTRLLQRDDGSGWDEFVESSQPGAPVLLRHLLEPTSTRGSIPLDEVESRDSILRTFAAGAMSFGAISAEAQRDIIVAMRQIGGLSNSGEGGENPYYETDGISAAVKQVASGRFGVTAQYLASAEELEIKIAQGAKPGEGGQLMGIKVDAAIAKARHSRVGVDLISPPPLHDVYSIEDLKQLIFELREVVPRARIAVKLVSGVGIGTIAVGVVKAGADVIHLSGHDGGTGAAPLSSMKHAGLPWELGLAEVHQALLVNGLRERVTLRVDGGLQTGFDVIVAAVLGAEQFAFGKLLLVAEGCIMARICENNRCPRGIATHDPAFKKKYRGSPEAIVAVLERLADDIRERLAALGVRSLQELLGRSEFLRPAAQHRLWMDRRGIDLRRLLEGSPLAIGPRPERKIQPPGQLEQRVIDDVLPAIERRQPIARSYAIRTTDRAVLARLSGVLAERMHQRHLGALRGESVELPLAEGIELEFRGSAGQGFAAFLVEGLSVRLIGEANDSVAKSMSGGRVTIVTDERAGFTPEANVVIGNVALYGATGGTLYVRGRAGDRFAVRNSGARAVVEGTGMHACEYMTGGVVAILGSVGENAGAGMTGGVLYLRRSETERLNRESVRAVGLSAEEETQLERLLWDYVDATDSLTAARMLSGWGREKAEFCKVVPVGEVKVHVEDEPVVRLRLAR